MGLALVREDRAGQTAGGRVVGRPAMLGSYVWDGEPLTASKWETGHKISHPSTQVREAPSRRGGQLGCCGGRVNGRADNYREPSDHRLPRVGRTRSARNGAGTGRTETDAGCAEERCRQKNADWMKGKHQLVRVEVVVTHAAPSRTRP